MNELRETLHRVADLIADYREALPDSHVAPSKGRAGVREALAQELAKGPEAVDVVVDSSLQERPRGSWPPPGRGTSGS